MITLGGSQVEGKDLIELVRAIASDPKGTEARVKALEEAEEASKKAATSAQEEQAKALKSKSEGEALSKSAKELAEMLKKRAEALKGQETLAQERQNDLDSRQKRLEESITAYMVKENAWRAEAEKAKSDLATAEAAAKACLLANEASLAARELALKGKEEEVAALRAELEKKLAQLRALAA